MATTQDEATVQAALIASTQGPLSIKTDAGEVVQRGSADLIAAANYLAGLVAMNTRRLGVRYTQLKPGATVQGWRGGPRWRDGGLW